jgi:hypothetical protein
MPLEILAMNHLQLQRALTCKLYSSGDYRIFRRRSSLLLERDFNVSKNWARFHPQVTTERGAVEVYAHVP